jgi:hypothetical protein
MKKFEDEISHELSKLKSREAASLEEVKVSLVESNKQSNPAFI